jgi:hypothetical protein
VVLIAEFRAEQRRAEEARQLRSAGTRRWPPPPSIAA